MHYSFLRSWRRGVMLHVGWWQLWWKKSEKTPSFLQKTSRTATKPAFWLLYRIISEKSSALRFQRCIQVLGLISPSTSTLAVLSKCPARNPLQITNANARMLIQTTVVVFAMLKLQVASRICLMTMTLRVEFAELDLECPRCVTSATWVIDGGKLYTKF